jgi:hypothetical protein
MAQCSTRKASPDKALEFVGPEIQNFCLYSKGCCYSPWQGWVRPTEINSSPKMPWKIWRQTAWQLAPFPAPAHFPSNPISAAQCFQLGRPSLQSLAPLLLKPSQRPCQHLSLHSPPDLHQPSSPSFLPGDHQAPWGRGAAPTQDSTEQQRNEERGEEGTRTLGCL